MAVGKEKGEDRSSKLAVVRSGPFSSVRFCF